LYNNLRFVGTGYSGFGAGLNNPRYEGMPHIGVIPQGRYRIELTPENNQGGRDVIGLKPYRPLKWSNMNCVIRDVDAAQTGALAIVVMHGILGDIAASRDFELLVVT